MVRTPERSDIWWALEPKEGCPGEARSQLGSCGKAGISTASKCSRQMNERVQRLPGVGTEGLLANKMKFRGWRKALDHLAKNLSSVSSTHGWAVHNPRSRGSDDLL